MADDQVTCDNAVHVRTFKIWAKIGRNSVVKNFEGLSECNAKNFAWKFLTVTEKSQNKRKYFIHVWRKWPYSVKIRL